MLGTDEYGRDVLSRLLSGAAPTVGGAFVVTLGATLFGLVLGVIAGSTHGLRSAVMNHILDTLLSIPSLLLAIIVVAFAGPHLSHAMFAVWLALLPRMVRSVYSMVHDELEKEYIIAARLDGASTLNILLFAILPNIASGLVTEITRALSMAILDIAALGFLDLGAQLPSPEWGAMLGDALEQGRQEGSLTFDGDALTLSQVLYSLWLGANLQAKITHSATPLESALAHAKLIIAAPAV